MDKRIDAGGISHVSTGYSTSGTCGMVASFIHHEMTPEREKELVELIEAAVFEVVKKFVAA